MSMFPVANSRKGTLQSGSHHPDDDDDEEVNILSPRKIHTKSNAEEVDPTLQQRTRKRQISQEQKEELSDHPTATDAPSLKVSLGHFPYFPYLGILQNLSIVLESDQCTALDLSVALRTLDHQFRYEIPSSTPAVPGDHQRHSSHNNNANMFQPPSRSSPNEIREKIQDRCSYWESRFNFDEIYAKWKGGGGGSSAAGNIGKGGESSHHHHLSSSSSYRNNYGKIGTQQQLVMRQQQSSKYTEYIDVLLDCYQRLSRQWKKRLQVFYVREAAKRQMANSSHYCQNKNQRTTGEVEGREKEVSHRQQFSRFDNNNQDHHRTASLSSPLPFQWNTSTHIPSFEGFYLFCENHSSWKSWCALFYIEETQQEAEGEEQQTFFEEEEEIKKKKKVVPPPPPPSLSIFLHAESSHLRRYISHQAAQVGLQLKEGEREMNVVEEGGNRKLSAGNFYEDDKKGEGGDASAFADAQEEGKEGDDGLCFYWLDKALFVSYHPTATNSSSVSTRKRKRSLAVVKSKTSQKKEANKEEKEKEESSALSSEEGQFVLPITNPVVVLFDILLNLPMHDDTRGLTSSLPLQAPAKEAGKNTTKTTSSTSTSKVKADDDKRNNNANRNNDQQKSSAKKQMQEGGKKNMTQKQQLATGDDGHLSASLLEGTVTSSCNSSLPVHGTGLLTTASGDLKNSVSSLATAAGGRIFHPPSSETKNKTSISTSEDLLRSSSIAAAPRRYSGQLTILSSFQHLTGEWNTLRLKCLPPHRRRSNNERTHSGKKNTENPEEEEEKENGDLPSAGADANINESDLGGKQTTIKKRDEDSALRSPSKKGGLPPPTRSPSSKGSAAGIEKEPFIFEWKVRGSHPPNSSSSSSVSNNATMLLNDPSSSSSHHQHLLGSSDTTTCSNPSLINGYILPHAYLALIDILRNDLGLANFKFIDRVCEMPMHPKTSYVGEGRQNFMGGLLFGAQKDADESISPFLLPAQREAAAQKRRQREMTMFASSATSSAVSTTAQQQGMVSLDKFLSTAGGDELGVTGSHISLTVPGGGFHQHPLSNLTRFSRLSCQDWVYLPGLVHHELFLALQETERMKKEEAAYFKLYEPLKTKNSLGDHDKVHMMEAVIDDPLLPTSSSGPSAALPKETGEKEETADGLSKDPPSHGHNDTVDSSDHFLAREERGGERKKGPGGKEEDEKFKNNQPSHSEEAFREIHANSPSKPHPADADDDVTNAKSNNGNEDTKNTNPLSRSSSSIVQTTSTSTSTKITLFQKADPPQRKDFEEEDVLVMEDLECEFIPHVLEVRNGVDWYIYPYILRVL